MTHKYVLTRQTEKYVEWECPECNRHLRVGFDGALKILVPGDQQANHGSAATVPWLCLDGASVETAAGEDTSAALGTRTIH